MKGGFTDLKRARSSRRAFTLIEILVVIAIIVLLMGITTQMMGGVQDSQGKAKARADMEVMATGLEAFNGQYGGYPRLNAAASEKFTAGELYRCLIGKIRLTVRNGNIVMEEQPTRTPFVDASKLTLGDPQDEYATDVDPEKSGVFFADPWREPYLYFYDTATLVGAESSWKAPGFILLSKGPDCKAANTLSMYNTGIIPDELDYNNTQINVDNIVQGREF